MEICEGLSSDQILALIAVNYAPIVRCDDGRWRSLWNNFPSNGIADEDVRVLSHRALVELGPWGAIVTDHGLSVLKASHSWTKSFTAVPARAGTHQPHRSLQ